MLLVLVACGGSGSGATDPGAASATASPPSPPPALSSVVVTPADLAIEPGAVVTLKATAAYDDGTSSDVTRTVTWRSADPSRLAVDSQGMATALAPGTVAVTATHASGASGSVLVSIQTPQVPSTPPTTPPPTTPAPTLVPVGDADWTETSVRKVLAVFAFGGQATDDQIRVWADMSPRAAIVEMLTFAYVNPKLSPAEDATTAHGTSLAELQQFWSGTDAGNPMRWDKRRSFATLLTAANGTTYFVSPENLQRTWTQAVRTRGLNPFLHRVAFFLSNYQLSIRASLASTGLVRAYYDQILSDLATGQSLTTLVSTAAKSAAVAARYDHRNNVYFATSRTFQGNDDFAREYFQLFFRLLGSSEDPAYHEGVSIENNALLLTGMQVDRVPNSYGSSSHLDWAIAPIRFDDHVDGEGRNIPNVYRHYADCVEILRRTICGRTASEKLDALSPVVAAHPEVMQSLPLFIVDHFADDQLTAGKTAAIRAGWLAAHDDLLAFLRSYAISTTFHRDDTVKFASAFSRNLQLGSATTLDNTEAFLGQADPDFPAGVMRTQDAVAFEPVHDVFGGQTGLEASLSAGIFKSAFDTTVGSTNRGLGLLSSDYPVAAGSQDTARWAKDWRVAVAANAEVDYTVRDLADWLWNRVLVDGGKNFDPVARAQVYAFLALGTDFGQLVTELAPAISTNPDARYSSAQLLGDARLTALLVSLAARPVALDGIDPAIRSEANRRMTLAAQFIAMMPYSFALEGR